MANNLIQIKRTSVSGRAANTTTLSNPGELALNMADGILYSGNGTAVFEIGANTTNSKVSGNLTVKGIIANSTLGTDGQVLTTNGTSVYWSTSAGGGGGGFTNGQSISVNNFVLTGSFTANSSNGIAGQVLTSSNTSAYWSNVSILNVYYANGLIAFEGAGVGGSMSSGGGGYYKGNDGVAGSASNANNLFRINSNTISSNITIDAGENALTVGPLIINSGQVLTILSGGRAVII